MSRENEYNQKGELIYGETPAEARARRAQGAFDKLCSFAITLLGRTPRQPDKRDRTTIEEESRGQG